MKKCCIWILAVLLLSGCAMEQTMETVADEWVEPVMGSPGEIYVDLPDEAAVPAVDSGSERMYLCRDYEILIQTLEGGDLSRTIQTLCGMSGEDLTVMQTKRQDMPCYEFVWAAAGESGDRLGRAVVLDDGQYHYCMTVLRDAATAESCQVVWSHVFDSFCLGNPG